MWDSASWDSSSADTCSDANHLCVCCPGSQIISQPKTTSTLSSMKNVWRQRKRRGDVRQFTGGRLTSEHNVVSVPSLDVNTHLENQYLSIDLQESLGTTGSTLLICRPWSYSVTSPVVYAQSYRKPTGDITTKESGDRFHISYLFCHYLWGTWTH